MDWRLSLCGFAVGALVGLTGMGGGSLMTALLILVFGIHPVTAVGTDLLYAAVTKATGTRVYAGHGNVDWSLVRLLATGSVPATVTTVWLLSRVHRHDAVLLSSITVFIGGALIISSISLAVRLSIPAPARQAPASRRAWCTVLATVVLGGVLGVLVSLTSVGAGALGLVVLRFLRSEMPAVRLVGSDIAHAVPLTLLAGIGHWIVGDVDVALLLSLLVGSIPGIIIASHFARNLPERLISSLLVLVLFVVGLRMVMH